jgi:hypothetical protein
MSTSKARQRNSSRIVATAIVALLIIVIAGIVLAGRKPAPTPIAAAPVPVPASTPAAASAPTPAPLNDVTFAAGSDKLPAEASQTIVRFAEAVHNSGNGVRITARYLTGENKARDLELAQARAAVVHHAFEADGVASEHMQTELIEMPSGSFKPGDANRIELTLR